MNPFIAELDLLHIRYLEESNACMRRAIADIHRRLKELERCRPDMPAADRVAPRLGNLEDRVSLIEKHLARG